MTDGSSCKAVERDPKRVSGAWVFAGIRVPVAALFENLEDGAPVGQFIEWFPRGTLVQVRVVLEHAARSALNPGLWSAHKSRQAIFTLQGLHETPPKLKSGMDELRPNDGRFRSKPQQAAAGLLPRRDGTP